MRSRNYQLIRVTHQSKSIRQIKVILLLCRIKIMEHKILVVLDLIRVIKLVKVIRLNKTLRTIKPVLEVKLTRRA